MTITYAVTKRCLKTKSHELFVLVNAVIVRALVKGCYAFVVSISAGSLSEDSLCAIPELYLLNIICSVN